MIDSLSNVLLLLILLLVALWIGFVAIYRPRNFLYLVITYVAITNVEPFCRGELAITFGTITVYPSDLLAFVAAVASVVHWALNSDAARSYASRFLLTGLQIGVLLGLIFWATIYGMQVSYRNEWSLLLQGLLLMRYAHAQRMKLSLIDFERVALVGATLAASLTIPRILTHGLGSTDVWDEVLQNGTRRPVNSTGAFILLTGFMVLINSHRNILKKRPRLRLVLTALLGLLVLVVQQRSVWVGALLAVIPWLFFYVRGSRLSRTSRVAILSLAGCIMWVALQFTPTLKESSSSTHTMQWRTTRWQESFKIPRSLGQWLFGSVLGPTPASNPDGFKVYAHSTYVDAVERVGFLGALAIVALYVLSFWRLRTSDYKLLSAMYVVALLGFSVTYRTPPCAWIGLGLLLWANRETTDGAIMSTSAGAKPDRMTLTPRQVAHH